MTLWKKIYFFTLIMFLLLMNLSIYMVFHMTYQKDIRAEENRTQATVRILISTLQHDITITAQNRKSDKALITALLESYEEYYKDNHITLLLYQSGKCLSAASQSKTDKTLFPSEKEQERITLREKDGIQHIFYCGSIPSLGKDTYLLYEQPLYELSYNWNLLWNRYVIMSVTVSIFVAIVLFLILHRLMAPIEALTRGVFRIQQGNYEIPVEVYGKDDIAKLSQEFNKMSAIIQKNQKEIEQESLRKQQFVDNFSHELKSPLTSIYGFAEYVLTCNISEEERMECMNFIMEESKRMLQLSYTLLDMAKLRKKDLIFTEENAARLLNQSILPHKRAIREKNITLNVKCDITHLQGNALLLASAFGNLISNAIHACAPYGEIEINLKAVSSPARQNCILFSCQDNGCGIPKEQIIHVMEPFYRTDKSRSRTLGGTGLGLSLCRSIVEAHHGTLEIQSEFGKGTIASIYLPCKITI